VEDLQAIRDFIGRDSSRYATAVVEQIVAAVDVLDRFPLAGRIVPGHARDDLREPFDHPTGSFTGSWKRASTS
jgi:plasmid stabilization system protein ParE